MHLKRILFGLFLLFGLFASGGGNGLAEDARVPQTHQLSLMRGQQRDLNLLGPARSINITTSDVISIFMPSTRTITITAQKWGYTEVIIDYENNTMETYGITVQTADPTFLDNLAKQLAANFSAIPTLSVVRTGDKVMVSGEILRIDAPYVQQTLAMFSNYVVCSYEVVDRFTAKTVKGCSIKLTQPTPNSVVALNRPVMLNAEGVGFEKVTFFVGASVIGQVPGSTKASILWKPQATGRCDLMVMASDAKDRYLASSSISVTVDDAYVEVLTPQDNERMAVNTSVEISAKALTARGVDQVEFYATLVASDVPPANAPKATSGATLFQQDSGSSQASPGVQILPVNPTPPFPRLKEDPIKVGVARRPNDPTGHVWLVRWTPTEAGYYKMEARMKDCDGNFLDSSTVTLRVVNPILQMDVQIVEVSKADMDQLGITWFSGGTPWTAAATTAQVNMSTVPGTAGNAITGVFNLQNANMQIIAWAQRGKAKILATPKLIVQSGQSAGFAVGGSLPTVSQGTLGASSVQYIQYGTQLQISPRVISPNEIFINVTAQISQIDAAHAVDGNQALTSRGASTNLTATDGDSFAIAGLLSRQDGSQDQKVPILGDIPVIGYLFKGRTKQRNDTETIVFLSPHILTQKTTPALRIDSQIKPHSKAINEARMVDPIGAPRHPKQ